MKPRVVLLLVVGAFVLPFVLAWWLNFGPWPWRPEAARNRGALLEPPVAVVQADVALLGDHDSITDPDAALHGGWSLVHAGPAACPESCDAALTRMRQSWLALGKDARRVQRWFLVSDGGTPDPDLLAQHPGLVVIAPTSTSSGTLVSALADSQAVLATPESIDGWVWMLDPRGFVILGYDSTTSASDMLKDMKRLLKYSAQDR